MHLSIFNPSNYQRAGHIIMPWQAIQEKTGLHPQEIILRDSNGQCLPYQIDSMDPNDASLDTLAFSLLQPVQPGPADYAAASDSVSIERGSATIEHAVEMPLVVTPETTNEQERVVGLTNSRISAWFNLLPTTGQLEANWYAGAATSIRLDDLEMLEAFKAINNWQGHDPEKRCIQIEQIQLLHPKGDPAIDLFNRPYQLLAHSAGPVRATITLASSPFEYSFYTDDTIPERDEVRQLQLYRILSLYSGADYIIEDLFLKDVSTSRVIGTTEDDHIGFVARYFAYMDLGFDPSIYQYPEAPQWFAIGSPWEPRPAYGFATDAPTVILAYPYQDPYASAHKHKRFSWQTLPCYSARCLHVFMRGLTEDWAPRVGRSWHELIDKTLKAQLVVND